MSDYIKRLKNTKHLSTTVKFHRYKGRTRKRFTVFFEGGGNKYVYSNRQLKKILQGKCKIDEYWVTRLYQDDIVFVFWKVVDVFVKEAAGVKPCP